jgi:hypothetical protein
LEDISAERVLLREAAADFVLSTSHPRMDTMPCFFGTTTIIISSSIDEDKRRLMLRDDISRIFILEMMIKLQTYMYYFVTNKYDKIKTNTKKQASRVVKGVV